MSCMSRTQTRHYTTSMSTAYRMNSVPVLDSVGLGNISNSELSYLSRGREVVHTNLSGTKFYSKDTDREKDKYETTTTFRDERDNCKLYEFNRVVFDLEIYIPAFT